MQAPSFSAEAFAALPFMALLGVRREFSRDGRARLVVDMRPELLNPTHSMHGGVVATLVDVVMASAAVSRVNFRKTAVTLNLNTSYLQPGHGRLTADGEVLSVDADGSVVQCQACVTDAEGRVVARSIGSFRYLDHR
ncbi:PaaI family thioesterase [Variovorax sp. UMC13]|uniref:PaaI family thioesterase n=1 Tax=Variovorax sp. UMC13 TaxID=1862326 RepID=UPI0015FFC676|nr:PaaI family thioesterase [Variovorax sp. UMC13]MBB1603788.1 thioesterase [Variovorax sp. UMC13]